jgi:hypothetical protein
MELRLEIKLFLVEGTLILINNKTYFATDNYDMPIDWQRIKDGNLNISVREIRELRGHEFSSHEDETLVTKFLKVCDVPSIHNTQLIFELL